MSIEYCKLTEEIIADKLVAQLAVIRIIVKYNNLLSSA